MVLDAILAWLHVLSILGVASTLLAELILLRPELIRESARWLFKIDLAYFGAAIVAVITGLARAVFGAKGWAFYAQNPLFHAKISLFVTIGVISIWPTIVFLRWAKALRKDQTYMVAPRERRSMWRWVLLELALFSLLPLLATMMSRGLKV